jgi:hypothetical protein
MQENRPDGMERQATAPSLGLFYVLVIDVGNIRTVLIQSAAYNKFCKKFYELLFLSRKRLFRAQFTLYCLFLCHLKQDNVYRT